MESSRETIRKAINALVMAILEEVEDEISMRKEKRKLVRTRINRRATNMFFKELEDHGECFATLRMTESCFNFLLLKIQSQIQRTDTHLRSAIPAKTKLQAVLYFLSTGCSLRTLTHLFGVGQSSISQFLPEVCEAIYNSLKDFIKVPDTTNWKTIENGFQNEWNFPGCCGAIDGRLIIIKGPQTSGSLYDSYNESNSIVLMAVADHKYCFSYVDIRCTGRISDGGEFHNCALYQSLEDGILPEEHVMVGNNAFPLKEYLLKPYQGNQLTVKQKIFNYRLSRVHRIIENTVGVMAARFRIFQKPLPYSPDKVVNIVKACCAMHNWLRQSALQNREVEYTVDTENFDAGVINHGNWRENSDPLGLKPLPHNLANHSSQKSHDLRERYADYFLGEGSVPWQTSMIDLPI